MSAHIEALTMPKWGLSMTEGTVTSWLVAEGAEIREGDEVVEIETEKMTGPVEALASGVLRRLVAKEGDVLPVGALLAVIADADVPDDAVQAFIDAKATVALKPDDSTQSGPTSEIVATSLGDVRVLVAGDAEDSVLLVHGFGGDALNWRFNIEKLAESYTVVAADLPGHGESIKAVGRGTLDELTSNVLEVLEARDLQTVHVVGHSLGGLIALDLAVRAPERVSSLVLIAPAGLTGEINRDFIDGFVSASSRREVKAVLRMLFANESIVTRQLVEEVLRYKRLEGVEESLATLRDETLVPNGGGDPPIVDLDAVRPPVLMIWGGQDQILGSPPPSNGTRMELIEGAGHSPHVEAADDVNRAVLEFVQDSSKSV